MPTPIEFDPNDPDFMRDPYPTLNHLRSESPIFWYDVMGMWFVSRYDDLNTLLRDRRLGRQITHIMSRQQLGLPPRNPTYAPFYMLSDNSMFDKEPPDHTRIRRLVHKVFTPRRVEDLRGHIQQIADDLLDAVVSQGEMDLLEDYAVPLPVMVIAALLGVPNADRDRLRPWSADIVRMFELNHTQETAQQAIRASQEFSEYLRTLSRRRRDDPRDDLISALAAVEDAGDTLTEDELIATCILLLNAGHEATVNGFGNGMRALLHHHEHFERLKAQPQLLNTTVEEMLRYDAPLQLFRRWVLEDMRYRGHDFKFGQEIAFLFGAANRDPETFPHPDTFDITRDPNPHISFGVGIHYCLGAPLARMELQISLATILRRFPQLEMTVEPRFKPSFVLRGLEALTVRF